MIVLGLTIAFAGMSSAHTDSLYLRAPDLSDSALIAESKRDPLAARDAVNDLLAHAVRDSAATSERDITQARRIATAYSIGWTDSILVRQVEHFAASSPRWRAAKVACDSIRRLGVIEYGSRGPRAAISTWRHVLAREIAIADSDGEAATRGNIGAALARLGKLDSAARYLKHAQRLAWSVGDTRVEANALAELAGISEARDSIPAARDAYAKVITLRQRIGDTRGLAADYNNLGMLAQQVGDMDDASRDFEAALSLNREEGRDVIAATNLVNLAALASRAGDLSRADSLYHEALTTWRAHAQWSEAADALRGLGELDLRRGDYPAARAELVQALSSYENGGLVNDALAIRQDLAAALAGAGQLQSALDTVRSAQRLADSNKATPGVRATLALGRADLSAQLNSRSESERWYRTARALYQQAGDRAGEAEAVQGLGLLLLDADDPSRARRLLTEALNGEVATGNAHAASVTRMFLGELALAQRDTAAARRSFTRAASELDHEGDPVASATAVGELANLDADAGLNSVADTLYEAALSRVGGRTAPHVTWRLRAGLASLREKSGRLDEAASEFRAALSDVERAGNSLALAERRSEFLSDKMDTYAQLALVERARNQIAQAFDVSEGVHAREMLELLARGQTAAQGDTAADLIHREQDLRHRIAELTRQIEGGTEPSSPLRGPDISNGNNIPREELVKAQNAYAELLLEVRERAPRHAALVSPPHTNWLAVAHALARDEALIEYLVSDSGSLAFVITADTIAAVDLAADRYHLSKTITFVRGVLEPRDSPRFDGLWRAPLSQLRRELVEPIEETGLLAGKNRLIVVPHAELHYLPFAALLDRETGRFLVERYEIAVTPSAAVWLSLRSRIPQHAAVGLLALAPVPDLLPDSRGEVESIAQLNGQTARTLIGAAATKDAFRRDAPNSRVLHLATYGILNKVNPLFSFIELAPTATDDGRLEVHDVFGLRLAADLVVLSACQTALASGAQSDVPAGDDWIGLARAFLHAGAARVIASLWPVQDRATSTLMGRFYRGYRTGVAPATALAEAQRSMLSEAATANPFYWAGFEVIGQR
ncbi:MAG TPA: CHAT domain-containing protein [Gemmatimonadaceae bacterium]|nr:CHAT domain-containing protein [Gemmatimonadaceae bacterium]